MTPEEDLRAALQRLYDAGIIMANYEVADNSDDWWAFSDALDNALRILDPEDYAASCTEGKA